MVRGKHGERAEARNFQNLEAEVAKLQATLKKVKADLSDSRSEVIRLKAIEAVFDGTKDVIAELEQAKSELADIRGKNFVLEDRLRQWGKVIMSEHNSDFVKVNREMVTDIVELGYWRDELHSNREGRRSARTAGSMRKNHNIASAMSVGWGTDG
jgi:hypothetical protein